MDLRCERCQQILPLSPEGTPPSSCPHCGHSPSASAEGGGLEEELGAAFDNMLQTEDVGASGPPEEDPAAVEWYVAIEGQQVGPVSFADLQERWARGVIGPDSLCWRAGLPDWVAIAGLPELLKKLPPAPPIAPRAEAAPAKSAPAEPKASSPTAPKAEKTPAPQAEEPEWKPSAARALESLVEKEMEEAEKREAAKGSEPVIPDPETTGIRVVLRDLPAPPPPEPSKFIPIPKSVPAPAPAPAARTPRPAAKRPPPKAESRAGLYVALLAILLVGGGAAAYFGGALDPFLAPAPAPAEDEAPMAAAKMEQEAEPAEVVPAEAEGEGEVEEALVEGDEEAAESDETMVAEAAEEDVEEAEEEEAPPPPPAEPARARPARTATNRTARATRTTERATEPTRQAAPKPAPSQPRSTTRSSSGDLLAAGNSSSIDNLFEQEMAKPATTEKSGASQPYIPPPPGSGVQKPQKLGQGEIMSVVANHRSALRGCATSYKEQGGGSGSVVMSWVIEPDGRTSTIKAAKGGEHAGMVRCLEEQIRGWKFPSYSGPKMEPIEFPFQF